MTSEQKKTVIEALIKFVVRVSEKAETTAETEALPAVAHALAELSRL